MKKIIIVMCLLFMVGVTSAQTTLHISTSYKEIRYWSPSTSNFVKGDNVEFASMFTLNGDETMFYHTTSDIKSTYYVDKKEYNTTCNCNTYTVTSDVGNKYTYYVDLDKNALKIMSWGHSDEKDNYLILFTIKKYWKD